MDYIRSHVTAAKTAPLAGNSIATDRGFIARDMPTLDNYLHYRMIDVSSIKELCRRWYPKIYYGQPEKGLAHRALADIQESIRELRYYRRTAFVAAAGALYQRDRRGGGRVGRTRIRGATARRKPIRPPRPKAANIDSAAASGDGGCSSVGRAPGCDPGCRGFESRQPPRCGKPPLTRFRGGFLFFWNGSPAGLCETAESDRYGRAVSETPPGGNCHPASR